MDISKLFQHKKVVYSLEIFPPKKESPYTAIYNTLLKLRGLPVDFISVTYGQGGTKAQQDKTVEIASLILETYHIEPVAHLTCLYSERADIESALEKFRQNKVGNIMVLRGDLMPGVPAKEEFLHASDLAQFIRERDKGFNLMGACYPEGHNQSESLDQDIENLKYKLDSGVTHLVTQLFFDNEVFYRFMDKVAAAGITVPIAAGIMPITNSRQIERTVALSGASVPHKMARFFSRYANNAEALKDAGLHYATEQIIDLIDHDVRGVHLYTMNNVETASRISEAIQNLLDSENSLTPAPATM
ncbi:MAG: methylenetetrahydrofolate reductase [NAD(P)H] [Anaerolineaceae bacterium]|nr:methylenetetrahydrofolate reductase [NAD(P)H] [Anaerolineaceae bacterium]